MEELIKFVENWQADIKAEVYAWSGADYVGLRGATYEAIKEIERQIAELKK